MIELIRKIIEEFNSPAVQKIWLPYLLAYIVIFLILLINYAYLDTSKMMKKILYVHGVIEPDDKEEANFRHFHNTDLSYENFKTTNRIYKENFEWVGKHYLFIPNGKLNTLTKNWNKLTLWYNGYISKSFTHKVKRLQKGWEKRKLSKKQIVNFNGVFIIGNLMVRTQNLLSLRIDSRNKKDFALTFLFDNGSERVINVPTPEFFDNMINTTIPYNIAFLGQCETIELW